MFTKEQIIKEFNLKPFGVKGWYRSNQLICPNCGQNDEFSLKFTDNGGVLHCLHSRTCNRYSISLYKYLIYIGRKDLVDFKKSIDLGAFPSLTQENNEEINGFKELSIKNLPIGFKRLYFDDYLENRNFLPEHYRLFGVGETKIDPRFINYNIFQFYNKNGECVAWMARSKRDKKWHDENFKRFKNGECDLILRYDNSPNTDFGDILGGENEITGKTDTLIIVEGLMDKVNVDKELGLLNCEEIKCCFTFGNKISPNQIKVINSYNNIKIIYLLYDNGSIIESKHHGMVLHRETNKKVLVCEIIERDKDPGELIADQLIKTMEESVNAIDFNFSKIDGIV